MSPASKSKSKDKRAAGKEPQKPSTKPTLTANLGGGVPASGYNPLLGTFHALETAPVSTASPIHVNGRSRNLDDSEDHIGMGIEYDSLSNNGSWSGESEDHKDKASQGPSRQETGPAVDSDKREKIRQKNEKKHQRQKERRAQELHERCSGYLMSRKLEALAQQLVAMGFSSERATMALILNEGRVEQSVAWLFEGGEDADNNNQREHNLDGGGNLKLDISDELARITEMEIKFKCSKQEVERAVVACEGDLEQAAETLKSQKQEPPAAPLKVEETSDSSNHGGGRVSVATNQNSSTSRTQLKHNSSAGSIPIQQKMDDKDFNYTKVAVTGGPSSVEPGIKSLQLLKKVPPNSEWTKPQQGGSPLEKRWPVGGSNPSVSYSLAAPPPAKTESRYATVGTELKNLQLGSVREPVIVMQRPKSKHIPASVSSSTSSAVSGADWHSNVVDPVMNMNPNGYSHVHNSTRSFSTPSYGTGGSTQMYDQFHYQQQQQQQQPPPHPQQQYASNSDPLDHHFSQQGGSMNHFSNGGMWNNRMVGTTTTPTLAAASSLGLFSGNGSSGPSSPVDWNAGDSLQFDYTNIDWSLDRIPGPPPSGSSRVHGMWMGSTTSNVGDVYGRGGKTAMRPPTGMVGSNGGLHHHHHHHHHLHPDGVGSEGASVAAGEWSSPFEEKELFSFPRQFVSSPSL